MAAFTRPVWAKTGKADGIFDVRINNSTRALPETEVGAYVAHRWPA